MICVIVLISVFAMIGVLIGKYIFKKECFLKKQRLENLDIYEFILLVIGLLYIVCYIND